MADYTTGRTTRGKGGLVLLLSGGLAILLLLYFVATGPSEPTGFEPAPAAPQESAPIN